MNRKPVPLSEKTLSQLPEAVQSPGYDRSAVGRSIVHFGVGGFHRAHQAAYTHELLQAGEREWGITGVGFLPRDAAMREALRAQDCLYTLVEQSAEETSARVIGSIGSYLYAPEDGRALLELMASTESRIVSMTVTEGGYYYDFADHRLRADHPDIQHDLRDAEVPKTWIGFVVAALGRRKAAGVPSFTVMSCDNIPENGHAARTVVTELARAQDPALADWIGAHTSFPNTMVDRITPATTDENRATLRKRYRIEDRWPVFCEDFRQWVIEDSFSAGRPAWDRVGAQFVPDVYPYELMKIRLLNGTHSALSYIAYLLGYRDVDAAVSDSDLQAFIVGYMREIANTLRPVPGVDTERYQQVLVKRFSNPAIKDQVTRLAMDGSQKIANSIVPPVKELLDSGRSASHVAFALAAWIRFCMGEDEAGNPIEIDDPIAETLVSRARAGGNDPRRFLGLADVFGEEMAKRERFVTAVGDWLGAIRTSGIRRSLRLFFSGAP